jgi:6-phosphofructokinase 1
MAGKTGVLISLVHDCFVHVPMRIAVSKRNCIDPEESLWRDVVEATGQPLLMKNQ